MPKKARESRVPAKRAAGPLTSTAVVILAAGKGTRLKSAQAKVLHRVGGQPMLAHVVRAAIGVVPAKNVFAIIGHEAEAVRASVAQTGISFILQREQLGTGHAIMTARKEVSRYQTIIVLSGDVPLIRPETVRHLTEFHKRNRAAMTILTAAPGDPTGYGRIIRKRGAEVAAIVEQGALRGKQLGIREINSGIYAFETKALFAQINKLKTDNTHREYYLTDVAALLVSAGAKVLALPANDSEEVLGVNTRQELARTDAILRRRKAFSLMSAGVTIFQPETCVIDYDVEVGVDTVIDPSVQLLGSTRIGAQCHIGSFCVIQDSTLADSVDLQPGCVIKSSTVGARATLGPYCHLRPATEVGEGAHIGNFVETKKTRFGKGSKAGHLTYLGDSEVGANVNVGAGTITCNYDGVNKFKTIIDDGAFIGSDSTLVAPVRVGAGAYIAASSCITEDVPAESLAIARARQVAKPDWSRKRKAASKSK